MKKVGRYWLLLWILSFCSSHISAQTLRFDFGNGKAAKGFTAVTANAMYSDAAGFGFEPGAVITAVQRKGKDQRTNDFVTANKPFFFSVRLPEGNYRVKLWLGDVAGTSSTIVRAECRRAVLPQVITNTKEVKEVSFLVHVRDTMIAGTNTQVKIKAREREYWHWDNKLTLEINDSLPKLCALEITPVHNVPVIFLAGNSTVVDQASEPYAAWGQMIPQLFQSDKVVVANYAESGEALNSFLSAKRLEKILSLIKPGDYLFIEFAHNDQKQKGAGIGPWESYTKLLHQYIESCRQKGGHPVLVTSMHRRNFDSSGHVINTLGDYPAAMRKVAADLQVPLIDLNNMSAQLYEAWGPKASEKGFVIYPANSFPGQEKALLDNTHFNPYGAYEIARCIAQGMRDIQLPLAQYLLPALPAYNPSQPDKAAQFYWPLSPVIAKAKPDGN